MPKKDQLKYWMSVKGFFTTHEVIQWGVGNYCNNADRHKRELVEEGIIRMLPKDEKVFRGYKTRESVYEFIER